MVVENLKDRIYAGNKRILRYTIANLDASGSPALDLTPFELRWALSQSDALGNYSTTPVLEKTTTGGGIVKTDASNGECEVTLVSADTVALAAGIYYFELEVVDGSSEVVTVATGTITILADVVNA